MTARAHELPEFFGAANITIKASSDDAYRGLIRNIVAFYRDHLFNEHWGEISPCEARQHALCQNGFSGLEYRASKASLAAVSGFGEAFVTMPDQRHHVHREHTGAALVGPAVVEGALAGDRVFARWRDARDHRRRPGACDASACFHGRFDPRPGASPNNAWWVGNTGEASIFWWAYQSLWLPESPLKHQLAAAPSRCAIRSLPLCGNRTPLQQGSCRSTSRCDRGREGHRHESIGAVSILRWRSFADGQGPSYPGIAGHEPSVEAGRKARRARRSVHE